MLAMALIATVIVAVSLAAGFVVRSRLAGAGLLRAGAAAQACLAAPDRWRPLARTLLRPERPVLGLAICLMLLDTALALAAPLPLMLVWTTG